MNPISELALSVAGTIRGVSEAFEVMRRYPHKTPVAFDLMGTGEPGNLTIEEVMRTRKVGSRMSYAEARFFVEAAQSAPWVQSDADLADADPHEREGLFDAMSSLYAHFSEQVPDGINTGKISKVLYLKLPSLYPILDSHLLRKYRPVVKTLKTKHPDLGLRRKAWIIIREELLEARASGALAALRQELRDFESGDDDEQRSVRRINELTDLRLLDILVW